METIETNSDYLPQPSSDGFATSQAPQIFSPFNSPQPLHKAHAVKSHAVEGDSDRKRKRADHDHSTSVDVNHHTGFNTLNSPVQSNPDLDMYIKSKRKPREKKACQVCRKRKVGCDQQQPCQNCIERRYPELCVYEQATSDPSPPNRAENTPQGHGHENSRAHSIMSSLDPGVGISPDHVPGSVDTVTIPRDYFDRLIAKLDHFQRSSSDLNSEIRSLISQSPTIISGQENGLRQSAYSNQNVPKLPTGEGPGTITSDGIHTRNELTGQTVHVGGNSVPAFVMAYGTHLEELLGTSLLPAFGLENESATYPFVGLSDLKQGRLSRVIDLCKTLPPEADIMRYFGSFRDISGVVYPAMANIDKFETQLFEFHLARAEALSRPGLNLGVDEQYAYGKSLAWIGLLFAALASGCQCNDVGAKELDLTSRVFVCCSFECLRLTNFLSNPSLENIQTLLILGNVISNTMNAGVAWALLGMTNRLGQVLGLHRPCRESTPQERKDERTKIAWTILWQESLLSITFDRAPSSTSFDIPDPNTMPYDSYAENGQWSYAGCMYRVCKVGLDIVQERRTPRDPLDTLSRMSRYEQELRQVMGGAAAHLKSSSMCTSLREQLQHWALYLHTSYIMSEVCREAIKPKIPPSDLAQLMKNTCLDSLTNTVRAFLGLNRLTSFASHSWAALSRALSSALVLGVLGEAETKEEVRSLLSQLLVCLQDILARNSDGTEISAPIKRWIATLTKLTSGPNSRQNSSAGTSPLLEMDSDDSPYARVEDIIWGTYA